jgi:sigma-E factor negative regulatory protein RseC
LLEAGIVIEAGPDRATVRMTRHSACAECGLCHQLAHAPQDLVLSAVNEASARPGDLVRVQVADLGVVHAAFWAYGVPTLAAVAGGVLGWVLGGRYDARNEIGAAIGMLVALVLGFVAVNRYDRRLRAKWQGPVVVEILQAHNDPHER